MKHFIRTAFWIFTLFGCLLAIPRRLMETGSVHSDFNIDTLTEQITCDLESTFYAQKHLQPKCITAALNCFHQEFNGTVREECNDPTGEIDDVLQILTDKINARVKAGHVLDNSTACACEQGTEMPFVDFLKEIESLLEKMEQIAKKKPLRLV